LRQKVSKKNQSLEKALRIMELLAENKGPMRLGDISLKLDVPTSTVLRFLNTLLSAGYVHQDPDSLKYSLSFKLCRIGELVRSQINIRDIARPFLMELSEMCQESTCLAVEENMSAVYIDAVEGPDNMLRTMQRIGKNAPLHSTGVGKLMLLDYEPSKLNAFIDGKGLAPITKHTITTKQGLLDELQTVKMQGYALDNEECEIGARCIAAPIRDFTKKTVACISVSGPTSRMTAEKMQHMAEQVKEAAARISEKLGCIKYKDS